MIDTALLLQEAAVLGLPLTPADADRLDRLADMLVTANACVNLTRITDPADILYKHLLDSLTVLPLLPPASTCAGACTLLDVGAGAGFPGLPLAIVRPDIQLTALDSVYKKLRFIQSVFDELHIPGRIVHARAEDTGRDPALRERFDAVTARAVAALPVLAEYCLPFVKVGGRFIAMKGDEDEAAALPAIEKLGGRLVSAQTAVPVEHRSAASAALAGHRLLVIEKSAPTPPEYPRAGKEIVRRPLPRRPLEEKKD
ncbi:MAG: 16S rRNA (guanine(527)-N(7))-methyltransferase RsmG [Oscillospiraceae bacterium]|nr:16S rRNA (guanine(527)-N(7))-methyltransferase RsmG [Oscillospiraceae bacterium]